MSSLTLNQLAHLYRQLATLIDAGLSPASAMDTLLRVYRSRRTCALLTAMRDDLWRGVGIAEAFAQGGELAPADHCKVIAAGERAGRVEETLRRLADVAEATASLRQIVNKELFPAKLTFLIGSPIFLGLVQSQSGGIIGTIAVVSALALFGVVAMAQYIVSRSSSVRSAALELAIGLIPGLRAISAKLALSRFARLFGALYGAGVPIAAALRLAGDASGSAVAAQNARRAMPLLDNGQSAVGALVAVGLISPQISNQLTTGTETGNIDQSMAWAASATEKETVILIHKFCVVLGVAALLDVGFLVFLAFGATAGTQPK